MAHARKQIRLAFITALSGLATTGDNVFDSRVNKLSAKTLPAICVYTKNEIAERGRKGRPCSLHRNVKVHLDIYVKDRVDFADDLDQICAEIEVAIYEDDDLQSLAKDIIIETTDPDYSSDGDKKLAFCQLVYSVDYVTAENDPTTLL